MKKTGLLLVVLAFFAHFNSRAQLTLIGEGTPFDEPKKGYNNTLVLNDGTICNLSVENNFGILLNTYDKNMKPVLSKKLVSKFGRLNLYTKFSDIFETKGQVVMIIREDKPQKIEVFRVVINPLTGELVKEDKILNDDVEVRVGALNAIYRGGSAYHNFRMAHDPVSSNYAYAYINTTCPQEDRKIVVKLYNKEHVLINDYTLAWGDKNIHKHIRLQDLVVAGDKVYTFFYALDLSFTLGNKGGAYLIADCSEKGVHKEFTKIEAAPEIEEQVSRMVFNPVNKKIYLMMQFDLPKKMKKDEGSAFELGNKIYIYDPLTKSVAPGKPLQAKGVEYSFNSLDDFYINADGSYSVVYQVLRQTDATNHTPGVTAAQRSNLEIGSSIILTDGDNKNSSVVSVFKDHYLNKVINSSLYNKKLDYDEDLAYKGHFFINGPKNQYIVMNDDFRNEQKMQNNFRPVRVDNLGNCNLFYIDVTGNMQASSRHYLLNDRESLVMISSAYYNPIAKVFAALVKDKKAKKVRLIAMTVN